MHTTIADRTAKGPYSTAIRAGAFVFLSGQGGLDPESGQRVPGGIQAETAQTLRNIDALLREAGLGMANLVQLTCYLTDIEEWGQMNDVFVRELSADTRPTRTAVGVDSLPFGLQVEMTAVAYGD